MQGHQGVSGHTRAVVEGVRGQAGKGGGREGEERVEWAGRCGVVRCGAVWCGVVWCDATTQQTQSAATLELLSHCSHGLQG